jgi:hypothetical protein
MERFGDIKVSLRDYRIIRLHEVRHTRPLCLPFSNHGGKHLPGPDRGFLTATGPPDLHYIRSASRSLTGLLLAACLHVTHRQISAAFLADIAAQRSERNAVRRSVNVRASARCPQWLDSLHRLRHGSLVDRTP